MAKQLTRDQFLQNLRESGLFSREESDAVLRAIGERQGDEAAVARALIAAEKLTEFQAAAVRERRFDELVIGNYQVLDRLGAGGMGTVYKARHRRMKRVVAIKVLARSAGQSQQFVERFQREVEAVARLNHPNIVMAHDADEAAVGPFLVMEFVNGRDLATTVQERGPLPVAEAVDCIVQAARALGYAHGQGVIHRDIKPANLMRDSGGVIKVADLGLARFNDAFGPSAGERSALTQAGTIMGTVDYMSPEQALGQTNIDHRTDIYSLGCTLYYLLLGRPPYQGPTMTAILLQHQQGPIPSVGTSRAEVPATLDQVFRRMVAKAPAERFPSMADVLAALETVPGVQPMSPSGLEPPKAVAQSPTVTFPQRVQDTTPAPVTPTIELGPDRTTATTVLLVEPSRSQAVIIRGYLQKLGFHDVRTCPAGQKALESARASPPGVVLSAMHLPDMTGVQLAQAMRVEASLSGLGFVLITSESDAPESKLSSLAAHAVRLPKPFDSERLGLALEAASGGTARQTVPAAPETRGRFRVLVVDDSSTARGHFRGVLAGLGLRNVTEAADGAEAVRLLAQGGFDLVVTDYNMPRLDGLGVIDYIRHRGPNPAIPVIVATTETDPAKLARIRSLGVSALCDKSLRPEVVRGVLEKLG